MLWFRFGNACEWIEILEFELEFLRAIYSEITVSAAQVILPLSILLRAIV